MVLDQCWENSVRNLFTGWAIEDWDGLDNIVFIELQRACLYRHRVDDETFNVTIDYVDGLNTCSSIVRTEKGMLYGDLFVGEIRGTVLRDETPNEVRERARENIDNQMSQIVDNQ